MRGDPTPPGTRDVLPDEMRELRALESRLLDCFEAYGYGPVMTPTIEYDDGGLREDSASGSFRFLDEAGDLLVLRSDMTIPVARLVSSRLSDQEPPIRLCYSARSFRTVSPQRGEAREFTQIGVESFGVPAPQGTAEVVEVLGAALDAAGLPQATIGLGDALLFGRALDELGASEGLREEAIALLAARDLVGLEAWLRSSDLSADAAEALCRLAALRGGPEVLEQARDLAGGALAPAVDRLAETYAAIEAGGAAERVRLDLGLLRDRGYYSGAILEVYDPSLGRILGGGGRYDSLMDRFDSDLPAAGFSLYLDRLHVAEAAPGEGEAGVER